MRIERVEPIPLRAPNPNGAYGSARGMGAARQTTLVRLESDDGLVGVGEGYGPPLVVAAEVRELAPLFVGQDPFDWEKPWARAVNGMYHWSRGGIMVGALSGIEIACWDLMGKAVGRPAAQLLGGWQRDAVPLYASTGYFTERPEGFRELIEAAAAEGHKRLKIKIGDGIASDLERIEQVFAIAGDDVQLMVDVNGNYTADLAIRLAAELDPARIIWLEEPLPTEDLAGYRRLREATQIPIAAGEADMLRVGFRELIGRRLVDVVQPDVCAAGGLGETKAIVRMAQAWNIRFAPHVWGSAVALAASLQLSASIASYPHVDREAAPIYFEYDRGPNALREELATEPFAVADGRIQIPRGPGLGIELDWAAVERYRIGG